MIFSMFCGTGYGKKIKPMAIRIVGKIKQKETASISSKFFLVIQESLMRMVTWFISIYDKKFFPKKKKQV